MQLASNALSWLSLIYHERFGHAFTLAYRDNNLVMALADQTGEIVFTQLNPAFLQARSDGPCSSWNAGAEGFNAPIENEIPAPCVSELPSPLIQLNTEKKQATLGYDIPGLTYWMLNRIEEIGRIDLDNHGRFPAMHSHAYKHGYLERPVVDEWLYILGQVIKRQWPQIELKKHRFSIKVSHDVDRPSRYGFQSAKGLARAIGGDVTKRKHYSSLWRAPIIRLTTKNLLHPKDPYNTFEWLMDVSEKHNLTSAFYFICGRTQPAKDADYEPEHPVIRSLMRRIHSRGHEIGLHPSYNTYQSPELVKSEAQRLRKICAEEGIEQNTWGGRMHYLRWEHPTTMQAWNDAGLSYDSTLSYADLPGFRCGTCFEYPAFNPVTQKTLTLRIRPLIVMECTIMAKQYMGLGTGELAVQKFLELKEICRRVGGIYTLLWHNSEINEAKSMYRKILMENYR